MNYKIITDENKLKEFIDWLPELKEGEVFYCCLFARSKYCKEVAHIKSDKAQLKRFAATKEWLLTKIKQLECPVGSYTQYGKPIPQEALALYINPNPRSLLKATKNSLIKFANMLTIQYNGYNPYQEVLSEIQMAKSRTVFVNADFDIEKELFFTECFPRIKEIFGEAFTLIETRGGFHLLIEPTKMVSNHASWYKSMQDIKGFEKTDDGVIPVAGTYQGGFTPALIHIHQTHD